MFIYIIYGSYELNRSRLSLSELYLPNRIRTLKLITHSAVREPREERKGQNYFLYLSSFTFDSLNAATACIKG